MHLVVGVNEKESTGFSDLNICMDNDDIIIDPLCVYEGTLLSNILY